MVFRAILQNWLSHAAKAKLRDAAVRAAQGQLAQPTTLPPAEEPKPCHLGIVFALGIESGCLEDLLQGMVTIRGNGFVAREGGLHGRRVVIDPLQRRPPARRTGDRSPHRRPSARPGDLGRLRRALSPELKRNDILIADRLLTTEGGEMPVDLPAGLSAALSGRACIAARC